ncbi:hypothetical protein [Corynebacterium glyciniphilum]|uniref:hypothetical protein n=1 Tax=Corynebacterium glyciniphilum TaxID=1404244 RepID=UPI0011AB4B77|nr:hypothetical protein [Corynebacterium glyciniphilum]
MSPTDIVLIFLIVAYFTSIIRQSWLSTRIHDLRHDNAHQWRVIEAHDDRLDVLEWRHPAEDDDLYPPRISPDAHRTTHPIPDKETTPCQTTSATHSPASDAHSDEQPETSSDASPTTSTPTPNDPEPRSMSQAPTGQKHDSDLSKRPTDAPGAPGTRRSLTTSTETGDRGDQ